MELNNGLQSAETLVASYLDWWRLAGVDMALDDAPTCALAQPDVPTRANLPLPVPARAMEAGAIAADARLTAAADRLHTAPDVAMQTHLVFPENLPEFQDWLAHSPLLPGAMWTVRRALPHGAHNPRLMVIGDVPDHADLDQGRIFSGPTGDLLDRMLAAIALSPDHVYKASFAITRPLPHAMQDAEKSALLALARAHIALVNPDFLLILGQHASQTLLGPAATLSAQSLRDFNHINGTVPSMATFHPRHLGSQPSLKRQAWQTLQRLEQAMREQAGIMADDAAGRGADRA